MPRLKLHGKVLDLASDDLLLPMAFSSFVHFLWLATFTVLCIQTALDEAGVGCSNRVLLLCYSGGAVVDLGLLMLTEIKIAKISTLGTIADDSPRRNIVVWMDLHLFLTMLDFVRRKKLPFILIPLPLLTLSRHCIHMVYG